MLLFISDVSKLIFDTAMLFSRSLLDVKTLLIIRKRTTCSFCAIPQKVPKAWVSFKDLKSYSFLPCSSLHADNVQGKWQASYALPQIMMNIGPFAGIFIELTY